MSATERAAYVGAPVKRREDESLLTGRGTYVDNMALAGTISMVVVRSPYAHARVARIDLDAARKADGVVAAFSAADLADEWKTPLPTRVACHGGHEEPAALPPRRRRALPG